MHPSLSLPPSIHPSIHLSLIHSNHPSLRRSFAPSIPTFMGPSLPPIIPPSIAPLIHPSIHSHRPLTLPPSIHRSIRLPVSPSYSPPLLPSNHPTIQPSIPGRFRPIPCSICCSFCPYPSPLPFLAPLFVTPRSLAYHRCCLSVTFSVENRIPPTLLYDASGARPFFPCTEPLLAAFCVNIPRKISRLIARPTETHLLLRQGLLQVDPATGSIVVLSNEVSPESALAPGTRIGYANDLDVAQDGTIYFSDSSAITPALNRDGYWDTMRAFVLTGLQVGWMSNPSPPPPPPLPSGSLRQ